MNSKTQAIISTKDQIKTLKEEKIMLRKRQFKR